MNSSHSLQTLHVHVYFTPSSIVTRETMPGDVFIVIDVIRATTTLAVMFERGASRVYVAESIEQAREAAQLHPERLLCGERNVKPIPGFHYGNSPAQFSRLDLSGRELILTTTNGTRAFHACPVDSTRLAGSLYNARAVAAHALRLALARESNIGIVCSGEFDYFALDDSVCAGYLVQELRQHLANSGVEADFHESALAAVALSEAFPPSKVAEYAQSAHSVLEANIPEDVAFCLQTNKSTSIPAVVGRDEEVGVLVLDKVE